MKKQVDKDHYDFLKYVNKSRFMSYYYQIKNILELKPNSVLEVGCGNNFLKNFFDKSITYKTLDFDSELKPDYIGSVTQMPIGDKKFDIICCFQVLEHLTFDKFEKALAEIHRVSKKHVLLSLPYSALTFKFELKLPFIKGLKLKLDIPKFYKIHKFDGEHYWEIGKRGYSLNKIKNIIRKYFVIEGVYNQYENPYHMFFRLRKK